MSTDQTAAGDVLEGVAGLVSAVTGRPAGEVRADRTFVQDLGVDSLAMIEILEGASKRFDVRIEDEAARTFVRVRDLVDYLQRRR